MSIHRRDLLLAGAAVIASTSVRAQQPHLMSAPSSPAPFAELFKGGHTMDGLSMEGMEQRVFDSQAPAGPKGKWVTRASMPLPRSEMAWAAAMADRLHVVGGYGEGKVNQPYHHVYDPKLDRWFIAALCRAEPTMWRFRRMVAVFTRWAASLSRTRNPNSNAFAYDSATNTWTDLAPLPRPRGAAAAVALNGMIHLIGGATTPTDERASIGWHEVYDPKANSWSMRNRFRVPAITRAARSTRAAFTSSEARFNTFEYNTSLHHIYIPEKDQWESRAPMPTVRSGIGLVLYRDRLFAMGGEEGHFEQGTKSPIVGPRSSDRSKATIRNPTPGSSMRR